MSSDEAGVHELLNRFAEAWSTKGGGALGGYFSEDGTLINPFGELAAGRKAVAAMYGGYFDGMLQGTTTTIKVGTVRAVGADHAFVDAEQTIFGPAGDTILGLHLCGLLRRETDGWRFVDARPYTVATLPD